MEMWEKTLQRQFATSSRLKMILEGFNQAIDPSDVINYFIKNVLNPQTATGWGLDVCGRIVGISRIIKISTNKNFGFSQQFPGVTTFGYGSFYSGADSTTNFSLSDEAYRKLIFAKAAANLTDCSIKSINSILMMLFSDKGRCYVEETDDYKMTFIFDFKPDPVDTAIISSNILPRPSGIIFQYQFASK